MSVTAIAISPSWMRKAKAIGVLSVKDIVNFVVDFFPESVLNLPADPEKAFPKHEDGG